MDFSNFEKSKGYKSKIPVRTIKPQSRLPVPSAAKENESKKSQTRPNHPAVIENVSSNTQVKTKKTTLVSASRKVLPPSQSTRFNCKGSVKTVTNRRLTNASNTAVNKQSTILQKVTKESNLLANKKPLNKEIVTENKRFAYAASQNKIDKLSSGKTSDVNRRYTNISNKGPTLVNKKSSNIKKTIENRSLANVDKIEIKRRTNFGSQNNHKKQLEVKQSIETLSSQESILPSKTEDGNFSIKAAKADTKSKKDVSFDQKSNCPSRVPDSPPSVNKDHEAKEHFLQPEVEFVADERYRNQILFGQGISPNSKPQSVKNSLISDRPSFFLKSKTALRALEKLEEEGRRASMMRMSGMRPTPLSHSSRAAKINPYQAVLRALENVDLAAEDRRVSTLKKNNLGSPRRDQSPMFKQQIDPYKTALKKIEALQMKRKAKSAKKVTFNLEPSDSAPKVSKLGEKFNIKSLEEVNSNAVSKEQKRDHQSFISNIDPKRLTPELHLSTNSASGADEVEKNLAQTPFHARLLQICSQADTQSKQTYSIMSSDKFDSVSNLSSLSTMKKKNSPPKSILRSQNTTKSGSKISDSVGPCFKTMSSILTSQDPGCSFLPSRPQTVQESDTRRSTFSSYSLSTIQTKTSPLKSILKQQNAGKIISSNISDSVGPCFRTLNRITSSILASEDSRFSFHLSQPQSVTTKSNTQKSTLSRLCTPKPISFFPKPCSTDSISPEFLCRRTSQIVARAPICTPMAMRTLAANLEETLSPLGPQDEESPVCQRLDFDEIEKENAVEVFPVCTSPANKIRKLPIQSIRTNRQILDSLADEECSMILSIASFPVITHRNVWNPVAQILTYGDDMHFVPMKLN